MQEDDPNETVRRLAVLAGLALSEERVQLLAATLPFARQGMEALTDIELNDWEPAPNFEPPSPEQPS